MRNGSPYLSPICLQRELEVRKEKESFATRLFDSAYLLFVVLLYEVPFLRKFWALPSLLPKFANIKDVLRFYTKVRIGSCTNSACRQNNCTIGNQASSAVHPLGDRKRGMKIVALIIFGNKQHASSWCS